MRKRVPDNRMPLFISEEGFKNITSRANSGDTEAKIAMLTFRFVIMTNSEYTELVK